MEKLNLKFTVDELNLILESLGNMPFAKVHQLIGNIQQQASQQLQPQNGAQEIPVSNAPVSKKS